MGVKISELDPVATLSGDAMVEIAQDGASYRTTVSDIAEDFGGAITVKAYGAVGDGVTDDTAAIQAAIDAAGDGGVISFPVGQYLVTGSITASDVTFVGQGVVEDIYPYGAKGSVIHLTSTANTPFKLGSSVAFERMVFFWPDQVDTPSAPIVYPPMIENRTTSTTLAGFAMRDCVVLNAYDFMDVGGLSDFDKGGRWSFDNCRICAVRRTFNLTHIPDTVEFSNCLFGWQIYGSEMNHVDGGGSGAGSSFYLRDYAIANSVFMRVWGDGTASAMSTRRVDGVIASGNFWWGFRTIFDIDGGALSGLSVSGMSVDATQQLLRVRNYGALAAAQIHMGGAVWSYNYSSSTTSTSPFIEIDTPAPGTVGPTTQITVKGSLGYVSGTFLRAVGQYIRHISVDVEIQAFARGTTAGTYYAGYIDAQNARVRWSGRAEASSASSGGVNRTGLTVVDSFLCEVVNAQFVACDRAVDITDTAGAYCVSGCSSAATGNTYSLNSATANITAWGNRFDKVNRAVEALGAVRVASAVNGIDAYPSVTGSPVELRAAGSDTNIDLQLTPKGSGNVRFGTHSAIGAETVTGYITVKDAGGTARKIAVVS